MGGSRSQPIQRFAKARIKKSGLVLGLGRKKNGRDFFTNTSGIFQKFF